MTQITNGNSKETSLVLRVCRADGTSHGGFQWPMEVGAEVIAPDWKNNTECGSGLHGWLYGQGAYSCTTHWGGDGARWMVLEVESFGIVMLNGKCKFERCVVRFVGDMADAADYVAKHEPRAAGAVIIGTCKQVGDRECAAVGTLGTATSGRYGTATAGDRGKATAGYSGTATAGDRGKATAGRWGTATSGDNGTAIAGDEGTATAGDNGTAIAGYSGTATAGDSGTATAGRWGKATAGDNGTAIAGDEGTATAGDSGELRIKYWDSTASRYRTAIAYVGEDGIKPNVAYKLDDNHEFVEVKT